MRGEKRVGYGPLPAYPDPLRVGRSRFSCSESSITRRNPIASRAPDMAHDSATRPAHRRHDSRRRRHRQDIRVHVPVRRPASGVACVVRATRRSAAWSSRSKATSACRFGASSRGIGVRTTTSRSGSTRPTATTRSTTISNRTRLAYSIATLAQQPVRPWQRTVLAAGVHRPREVPDPAAEGRRRIHDACRDLSLRDRRELDRARLCSAASRCSRTAAPTHSRRRLRLPSEPCRQRLAALDSRRQTTSSCIRTMTN